MSFDVGLNENKSLNLMHDICKTIENGSLHISTVYRFNGVIIHYNKLSYKHFPMKILLHNITLNYMQHLRCSECN